MKENGELLDMLRPFENIYNEFFMDKAVKLGSGSFGKVYLIECREDGATYAAKYQQLNESSKRSVRVEAEMLAILSRTSCVHSSILLLKGYYETKIHTLLVTEYLPGGELCQKITDPNYLLTERKCKSFVRQIAQGLDYIHSHKIIHLDVKPQNIMLKSARDDTVKLIDFGLARKLTRGKVHANMIGTVGFMAPEVLKCTQAGPGTDFFSLGVVTFMLLSGGYEPFWFLNDDRTIKRTLHLKLRYSTRLSEDAKSFLTGLLEKNIEKRLVGEKVLNHPWLRGRDQDPNRKESVLETLYFKRYLARTRWAKALKAVRFAVKMRKALNAELDAVSAIEAGLTTSINMDEPSEIPTSVDSGLGLAVTAATDVTDGSTTDSQQSLFDIVVHKPQYLSTQIPVNL